MKPSKPIYPEAKLIRYRKMPLFDIVTVEFPKGYRGCPKPMQLTYAQSKLGEYIGETRRAYRLVRRYGICHFERTDPTHCVVSIGYSLKNKKWYGWSHRAIYGYKRKRDAIRFAQSVS